MKKFRGTKFARIGVSYTPRLDAEIARLEAAVLAREARLTAALLEAKNLLGENDFSHWGE